MDPLHSLHSERPKLLTVHDALAVDNAMDGDVHVARINCEFGRHRAIHLKLNALAGHLIVSLLGNPKQLIEAVLAQWLHFGKAFLDLALHRTDL